jgi:hypothetical protein
VWHHVKQWKNAYFYQINAQIFQILAIFRDFWDIFAITVKPHKTHPEPLFFWKKWFKNASDQRTSMSFMNLNLDNPKQLYKTELNDQNMSSGCKKGPTVKYWNRPVVDHPVPVKTMFSYSHSESNLAPHNTSTTQAQVLIFKAPFSNTTHRYKWHLYQCCTSVHKCKK